MSNETGARRRKKRAPKFLGSVFSRDGVYGVRYRFEGRDIRESTKSRRKQDAVDLLKQRIGEIRDGTFRPGAARVTLADLRDMVLADYGVRVAEYERRLPIEAKRDLADRLKAAKLKARVTRVRQAFANLERVMDAGTTADRIETMIPDYRAKRMAESRPAQRRKPRKDGSLPPAAPPRMTALGTVTYELRMLLRGFRLAKKTKRIALVPDVELAVPDNARQRAPKDGEVEAVMEQLPTGLRHVILFELLTGFRGGEARFLEWRHVDLDERVIRLESHEYKGGRRAKVYPFAEDPDLEELIRERRRLTDEYDHQNRVDHLRLGSHAPATPWVFWHEGLDEHGLPAALPYREYLKTWHRACKRAEVVDLIPHDLRRGFTRNASDAGLSEATIIGLVGWRDRSMLERYDVRSMDDLRHGARKMAQARQERARTAKRRPA